MNELIRFVNSSAVAQAFIPVWFLAFGTLMACGVIWLLRRKFGGLK